jgi:hypothetical protein
VTIECERPVARLRRAQHTPRSTACRDESAGRYHECAQSFLSTSEESEQHGTCYGLRLTHVPLPDSCRLQKPVSDGAPPASECVADAENNRECSDFSWLSRKSNVPYRRRSILPHTLVHTSSSKAEQQTARNKSKRATKASKAAAAANAPLPPLTPGTKKYWEEVAAHGWLVIAECS